MEKIAVFSDGLVSSVIGDELKTCCKVCYQEYTAKYWDEDLEWYIILNDKGICQTCEQQKMSS